MEGYVLKEDIKLAGGKNKRVEVREQPNPNSKVVTFLTNTSEVKILERLEEYYKVKVLD